MITQHITEHFVYVNLNNVNIEFNNLWKNKEEYQYL